MKSPTTNPWEVIAEPSSGYKARRIDSLHPHNLFWARDIFGRYAFFFCFSGQNSLPSINSLTLAGIELAYQRIDGNQADQLVLVLKSKERWELFRHLCQDLVDCTRSETQVDEALEVLVKRLFAWQAFLKSCPDGRMLDHKVRGLIGELWFLRQKLLPVFGGEAIRFWQGPKGFPQDFAINNCAVEVKAHLASAKPNLQISSLEQLHTLLPSVLLFVVELTQADRTNAEAVNLEKLIASIRSAIASPQEVCNTLFEELLLAAGYQESQNYESLSFLVTRSYCFRVAEGFPRLTPDHVPQGITQASYSISVAACQPYATAVDWGDT